MKISILMPTYSCPTDLLEKSVRSIVAQTHTDWELVIKDGDVEHPAIEVPEIKSLFESLGDKVKYFNSPDGPPESESGFFGHNGFYEALNHCVHNSTGHILTLLCADDERGEPNTLAYVNEMFERHGSTPYFVYGACQWIDREGRHLAFKNPPVVPITFEGLLRDYTLYTPSLYWNRGVHTKFGMFDRQYAWCADLDFWLRCWRGIDSCFTRQVIGKYRVWGTSQARENESRLGEQSLSIQARHRATL